MIYIRLNCVLSVWKMVPNIKKPQGRAKLLSFLGEKLNDYYLDKKQIFEKLRYNYEQGWNKKIKFIQKVIGKDLVYCRNFFYKWRRNVVENNETEVKNNMRKKNSLMSIIEELKRKERANKK